MLLSERLMREPCGILKMCMSIFGYIEVYIHSICMYVKFLIVPLRCVHFTTCRLYAVFLQLINVSNSDRCYGEKLS